ncbi:MAG TPA: hypothetical protein ENN84_10670 [Candidatus Marinimicrobia bacterium]|nr:hypothetical protein [Candidatus Neomarinimicrobiota bacterium]
MWLATALIIGFLATSLLSFFISRESVRKQISQNALPLTAENVYAEIRKDLLEPVIIAPTMAHNTFLQDWIKSGENNIAAITAFLHSTKEEYNAITAFCVSEQSRNYYYSEGILKKIKAEESRDEWYFRVRDMDEPYELNVDPDLANQDAMTLFINYKIFDKAGQYLGATGIGFTISSFLRLIESYHEKYHREIYFSDLAGNRILEIQTQNDSIPNIKDIPGLQSSAHIILSPKESQILYSKNGNSIHLNTKHIPELNWVMYVEQNESEAIRTIYQALFVNLSLCAMITIIFTILIQRRIRSYQRLTEKQKSEIIHQHTELLLINKDLLQALEKVKRLRGLLPICASCKKIRDDKGYWQQIEVYIKDHSDADFSHGICPDCMKKLYPEYDFDNHDLK